MTSEHFRLEAVAKSSRNRIGRSYSKAKPCTDHTGPRFQSQRDMLNFWGVSHTTFRKRRKERPDDLAWCLTAPDGRKHNGGRHDIHA